MNIFINVCVVLFYLVVWFVTRYFYRKHKKEILVAVNNGEVCFERVTEESVWFRKCTLAIALMALVGVLVPKDSFIPLWWLVGSIFVYFIISSCSESLRRGEIRREVYETRAHD